MGFPAELKMMTFGPRSFGFGGVVSSVSEIFDEAFELDDNSRSRPRRAACLFDFFDLDALAGMINGER